MVNFAIWIICTILRILPVPAGEKDKWLKLLRHICGKYALRASDQVYRYPSVQNLPEIQSRERGSGNEFPSQSPDLNPNEYTWRDLGIQVQRLSPSNDILRGSADRNWRKSPNTDVLNLQHQTQKEFKAVIIACVQLILYTVSYCEGILFIVE